MVGLPAVLEPPAEIWWAVTLPFSDDASIVVLPGTALAAVAAIVRAPDEVISAVTAERFAYGGFAKSAPPPGVTG